MNERLLDDIARALAQPMPRRRALKVVATVLLGMGVGRARQAPGALAAGSQGGFVKCGTIQPPGAPKPFDFLCQPGSTCCQGTSREGERAWTQGRYCCIAGYRCSPERGGSCVKVCPAGRVRCGSRCCERGERCVGGRCTGCSAGQRACGQRCCPQGSFCCHPRRGLCCPAGSECCNTAPPGQPERWTCCPKGTSCAPLLELTETGRTAGVPRGAPRVCCPAERAVPLARKVCCPPGHVSLGGDLVLPPGGGGGLCCRKDKLCGSGQNVTCCSSGSPTVPELETHCCDGRCVNLRFDSRNCGACGRACAPGQRCQGGRCVPA